MRATARSPRLLDSTDALGTVPIGRLLWCNCSQTTISVGIYGTYALSNAWFVARGVGVDAMAAVNLAAPVLLVLGAVSTTVGAGGASLVSRRLGAHDPAGAARAAGNAFVLYWLTAVSVSVIGLLFLEPILTALGARDATREFSREYTVVLLCGTLAYTGFSSVVRAEGRQRYATVLWVVAVVIQMLLDPLLIFGFHLGVRGAALGTVGGQTVSFAMSLWFFFGQRRRPYRITRHDLRPHGPTIRALLEIGSPSFLAGLGATLLVLLTNNVLAETGTVSALAAYAVCGRIQTFVTMPQRGISQGLQPIVGYNVGRGLLDRVQEARRLALSASVAYGVFATLVVILLADPLAGLFVDQTSVRHSISAALRIIAIGIPVAGIAPLVSSYFQSIGRPRPSYLISVGTLLLIKVPLVLGFSAAGPTGIWVSSAFGEMLSALAATILLHRFRYEGKCF